MTPLASQLAKQLVCRPTKRKHIWRAPENLKHLRESLTDIHCFEATAILPLLGEMAEISKTTDEARTESLYSTYAFLPAPKTWIEWRHGSGNRIGILLEEASRPGQQHEQNRVAVLTFFSEILAQNLGIISQVSSDYFDYGGERHFPTWLTYGGGNVPAGLIAAAHTMLVLINSPKIIGRSQFMPNAGLERRLTRGLGAGAFPLHAWSHRHKANPLHSYALNHEIAGTLVCNIS